MQGYLYSGTVDYISPTSSTGQYYIWMLLLIGFILPNVLILASHAIVIIGFRQESFPSVFTVTHFLCRRSLSGLASFVTSSDRGFIQQRMKVFEFKYS